MGIFQEKLLHKLQTARESFINTNTPTERKSSLAAILSDLYEESEGHVAVNFRTLIDPLLSKFDYNIDKIIYFLKTEHDNQFDIETVKRETGEDFDMIYGTQTSLIMEQIEIPEVVSVERLASSSRFHPTPVRTFREGLKALKEYGVSYDQWTFVDIGSGLGRNLLLANEFPFKKIIGVEISAFLCGKAEENIQKYNLLAEKPCLASVLCMNALDFTFPEGDFVLYCWQPFGEDVQVVFTRQLEASLRMNSRNVFLIFLGPVFNAVKQSSFFRPRGTHQTPDIAMGNSFFSVTVYSTI